MRDSGVHHLTFTAILDALTPDGGPSNAWAVATLGADAVDVEGGGAQPSYRLCWGGRKPSPAAAAPDAPAATAAADGAAAAPVVATPAAGDGATNA